jgi:hypothetical protein
MFMSVHRGWFQIIAADENIQIQGKKKDWE